MIGITKGPSYASCLAVCGKDLGRTASSFKGFSDWQRDLCLTLGLQVIGETILCRLYISSDDEKDSENPWNEGTSRRDVQSKISNIRGEQSRSQESTRDASTHGRMQQCYARARGRMTQREELQFELQ
ncbi:hypothetical protein V6N11_069920 [Hibiscus sabdariffa]|uniref:Uncharacterized protein n=1 Tax=Hibiscus sabdariffa TaxID=183260 RepID=A0ABR2NH23_9ROSI